MGWERVAVGQRCSVGLLKPHWGPLCECKCFSGAGWVWRRSKEMWDKIPCWHQSPAVGGPKEAGEEWRGGHPVDITPQQSRPVWMDGPNGLRPRETLVLENTDSVSGQSLFWFHWRLFYLKMRESPEWRRWSTRVKKKTMKHRNESWRGERWMAAQKTALSYMKTGREYCQTKIRKILWMEEKKVGCNIQP